MRSEIKSGIQAFRSFPKILSATVALSKSKLELALCIYIFEVGLKEIFGC